MNTNIEKEFKLLVDEEVFYKLCSFYPQLQFKKQVNTYYDTIDHQIQKRKGAMRIREVNDEYIFTLKLWKDEDLLEFECEVDDNTLASLQKDEVQELLTAYDIQGELYELTTLITHRGMIITDDAELCFDINEYNNHKDYEIEYEYKRDHDGYEVFNKILKQVSLSYTKNCSSKIKRALDSL